MCLTGGPDRVLSALSFCWSRFILWGLQNVGVGSGREGWVAVFVKTAVTTKTAI